MKLATYEGIVESGQIKLPLGIELPEKAKVYVVVPEVEIVPALYIGSPRLVHSEQLIDFKKEVIEESLDASL